MKTAVITTVKKGKHKGAFKFTLVAANGEAVAQSWPESYTQKKSCIKTLSECFPAFTVIDETIK